MSSLASACRTTVRRNVDSKSSNLNFFRKIQVSSNAGLAAKVLKDARRSLYRILAEDE